MKEEDKQVLAAAGKGRPRRLRILYVEDEEPVRKVFTRYLQQDGHAVDGVPGGREALEVFDPVWYDLVITDHAMPGMSGEEFALELKKRAPGKPVILLSGHVDSVSGPGKGTIDLVLKKPATLQQIRSALATLFPAS